MASTSYQQHKSFLSNFYISPIVRRGITYPTAEHAYQAAKTSSRKDKIRIASASSPMQAKHFGYGIVIRPDWESKKVPVMAGVVRQKFLQNPNLISKLLYLDISELAHENDHGDKFWGTVNGIGEDHLGNILRQLYTELE